MDYPDPPTRIVEPVVSPETAAPTPAVACPECTIAGNEALATASRRGRKAPASPAPADAPDDSDPAPHGAD